MLQKNLKKCSLEIGNIFLTFIHTCNGPEESEEQRNFYPVPIFTRATEKTLGRFVIAVIA